MAVIHGGSGADNRVGTRSSDVIRGFGGNDYLSGLAGDDQLYGGDGNDWIFGGDGTDRLYGDEGSDFLFGENGTDFLDGGNGDDLLDGGQGNDTLFGGAGRDLLTGGFGLDRIDGGSGVDMSVFTGRQSDYRIVVNLDGTTTVTDLRKGDANQGVDTLLNVERLFFGGDFSFRFLVANNAPTLISDANPALNILAEGAAAGTLVGVEASSSDADGDSVIYSIVRPDGTTALNDGRFAINPLTGVVSLFDAAALNYESAASHTIVIRASDGFNSTDNSFTIQVANVAPSAPTDSNLAANTLAEDAAVGSAVGITASAADPSGGAVSYYFRDGDGNIAQTLNGFTINALTGVVTLAAALDHETAASHSLTIYAADSSGAQSSQGFTVNVLDVVEGVTITLAEATHQYVGEMYTSYAIVNGVRVDAPPMWADVPLLTAQGAAALLWGGTASQYSVSISPDTITHTAHYVGWGEHSPDFIFSESYILDTGLVSFNDPGYPAYLTGDPTARTAWVTDPNFGPNYVWQIIAGQTTATGTEHDDLLTGNSQNNVLIGLAGDDVLTGGGGADIFIYKSTSDSTPTLADIITDFSVDDRIDLSFIDAVVGDTTVYGSGSNAYTAEVFTDLIFAGQSATTIAHSITYYHTPDGRTVVQVDTDGVAGAEMEIELVGVHTLTSSSFIIGFDLIPY